MQKIVIDGVIGDWDVSSQWFIDEINSKSEDITIEVNSIGGSVIDGIAIFNAIKAYDKGTITAKITGYAASIASYIVLACDKVTAYDNTTYMIHNASLPTFGDYRKHEKAASISRGLSKIIAKAYVSKTSMSDKDIRKLMEDEKFYYGAEMYEAGFVDEIISTESTSTKAEAVALASELLGACNNALYKNANDLSLEAVAKLLPPEIVIVEPEVADLSARQQRARKLLILNKELQC
ncbi:MAG: Clp protease ClpP [Sulfurimonas sp.]|nr:Clp protease ClpP [Sulfurimonas sp.]PHQ90113.1 MAG: hypothetical protein COB42_05720 [Sulfurimonas sp.]